MTWAHPRSRGENPELAQPSTASAGSSPLTRGKRVAASAACVTDGLIPAHAGKTREHVVLGGHGGAHPRSRGENSLVTLCYVGFSGSSPLTRGKPWACADTGARRGLIPAHAGKTVRLWASGCECGAHPRSRGENFNRVRTAHYTLGSSPLTRGKLPDRGGGRKAGRLIPAHAGKTICHIWGVGCSGAHPRSRGENAVGLVLRWGGGGSSPLTRGNLSGRGFRAGAWGHIPAHAGKTRCSGEPPMTRWAHPRSRGENLLSGTVEAAAWGSSPLTRGKHFLTCAFIAQIDQILESLELCASSESYSSPDAYATDAPRDRVRSIDLGLRSSRGAS